MIFQAYRAGSAVRFSQVYSDNILLILGYCCFMQLDGFVNSASAELSCVASFVTVCIIITPPSLWFVCLEFGVFYFAVEFWLNERLQVLKRHIIFYRFLFIIYEKYFTYIKKELQYLSKSMTNFVKTIRNKNLFLC